ncbi:tRNA nucleotidyltransferase [Methylomarinovum caldicuralii]|uniref:tRNA nucleotidyltransferase n=1 Tax=Methylomarinovum caldicuralii TaxID=438856 RepID=A0AAU9BYM3_9GAMM|nr:archease [Methylomarinovum caldicuralii]BCX81182.1 tRNA nucleotidyltransferase [Methylomarinovum caldicuralii]
MAEAGWEHFEHMADIGVRGWGPTLEEAFAQAALALTAVVTDPARVEPRQAVTIELERDDDGDLELLLVDFLDAVIYEMAVRKMLFSRFDVEIDDRRLRATLWGEPVDRAKHQPAVEVKGATFTELKVTRSDDGRWVAQCVLDV